MENVQIDNTKVINKSLKMRKVTFLVNIIVTFVSIIGVLSLMIFCSFLDNILEGTKKIVFYGIIIFGLLFWLAFVLIDRLVNLNDKELLYLSVAGTKNEHIFYEEYPNPNEDNEINDLEKSLEENVETPIDSSSEETSIEENTTNEEVKEDIVQQEVKAEKYKLSKNVILFSIFSNVGDIYSVICAAFFVVALIFCFILFPATVVGQCMEPLLYEESFSRPADKILAIKNAEFVAGDVVVFAYDYAIQEESSSILQGELLIKRVIAGPGQTFEVKNGKVYVDGVELVEDYVKYPYNEFVYYDVTTIILNNSNKDSIEYNNDNVVPEGYYILLGDNRVVANDSHYFGLVREDQICGKVVIYKNQEGWHKIN